MGKIDFPIRSCLLLTCLLWAISFVATKVALAAVLPLTLVSLRLLISAFCFFLWFVIRRQKPTFKGRAAWARLFVLSLFGTGLHYGLQTLGLQYTSASNSSIYAVTGPISIALIAALFLGEKMTTKKWLGIAVAVAGVLWVMGWKTLSEFDFRGHLLGDLLVMASIVMWGMFTVYGKRLMAEAGAFEVIALTTMIGAVWMAPVGWIESHERGFTLSQIPQAAWVAVAYLGVACSFFATLLYFWALKRSETQKVGVYLYTIPPMTYVVAAIYLGEQIGINLLFGSILILIGVYLTERG
jgi:drug/metabolite transporter (DMT)-like permease